MSELAFDNPAFRTYVVAAGLAVLKLLWHGLYTVQRMMRAKAGWASPEDLRRTALNPEPHPDQLAPNDDVERARRMHRNEIENTTPFLAAGLVFVAASPPAWLAAAVLYGYVATRVAHAYAYATARDHEVRAAFYTIGVLLTAGMVLYAFAALLRG